jgi:carbamoyltransferase
MTRILAIHPGPHDCSAAAFDDYRLVAAIEEERLTRIKGSGLGVSWVCVDEVLRIAGWSRHDVDALVSTRSFFPPRYFRFPAHQEAIYALRRSLSTDQPLRELAVHCQLRRTLDAGAIFRSSDFLRDNGFRPDIPLAFVNHHEAHALSALFFTDWDDALIYTADGVGDNVSYSVRTLRDGELNCQFGDDRWLLQRHPPSNSLALAYGYATEACGFKMLRHEGKLTGLAALGQPNLAPEMARHFWIDGDGMVAAKFKDREAIRRFVLETCRGHPREVIAASIQQVTEDLMLASVRSWIERTGSRRLGLCGGLFANVRLNRVLAEQCPLDEVFVYPAMGDGGLSVGAGLVFLLQRDGLPLWLGRRYRLDDLYLGYDYGKQIDAELADAAAVRRLPGTPAEAATQMLLAGRVGAAYIGRMEFGPRALGARSILARPDEASINDELNKRLARSEFMPFAPYVLDEDADKVFEISDLNRYTARFMTITCAVRDEWKRRIAAVVHVDGTARPQIVRDRENPLYAEILRRFRAATGLPVLVNTSFNVHEEPIVNRPAECLRALHDGRVDFVTTEQACYTLADRA